MIKWIVAALVLLVPSMLGVVFIQGIDAGGGGTDYTSDGNCQFAALYEGATCAALAVSQCGSVPDLTCNNTPTVVTSCPSGSPATDECLDFDAGSSEDMSATDGSGEWDELEPSGSWAAGCWVYAETSVATMRIFQKIGSNNGFNILLLDNGDMRGQIDGDFEQSVTSTPDGTWAHLVALYDAGTNEMQVFVDGVEDCETGCNTNNTTGITANSFDVSIASNVGASLFWDGKLYECFFIDRLLSDAEVCEICRLGLRGNATDRNAACNSCTLP